MFGRIAVASAALLLAASPAGAAESAARARSGDNVQWLGHVGAVGGDGFAGVLVGTSVMLRTSVFAAGGAFDASGMLAGRIGASGAAGLSFRSDGGMGLDLLATLGVHAYSGVGRGTDDPGASATLPFAGARARASQVIARRMQVGLSLGVETDLYSTTRAYSFQHTPWLNQSGDSATRTESASHTIGFSTAAVLLDVGAVF